MFELKFNIKLVKLVFSYILMFYIFRYRLHSRRDNSFKKNGPSLSYLPTNSGITRVRTPANHN